MPQRLNAKTLLITAAAVIAVIIVASFIGAKTGFGAIALAAMTIAVFSAVFAWLLWAQYVKVQKRDNHGKQMRFIADRFRAMVRSLPGGYCLFTPHGLLREEFGAASRLGIKKVAHFDDIVAAVKDGTEIVRFFRLLQQSGEGFSQKVKIASNDSDLQIVGRRFRIGADGPQVDMLWFSDNLGQEAQTKPQSASPAVTETKTSDTQSMIDALPFPVWARSNDLRILMCNSAYAKAMDSSIADVLREQHELMSQTAKGGSGIALAANALSRGETQSERRHVIISGKRRLLEIKELPFKAHEEVAKAKNAEKSLGAAAEATTGKPAEAAETASAAVNEVVKSANENVDISLIGFAVDVTGEEEKDTELQRHLAAHHEVMEHLGSAIAIYGADKKLEFYNRAYQRLWDAEEVFLNSKPSFGEVLEDLRTRRRVPEQADFQRYKREREALFTSLLEPHEDLMYLPDGTSLRILAVPHPFGGLMFVHENVTDRLALESSYNTLMAVQRETLDNLAEGIAVFGPDGKLRLFNPAFARIWNLSQEFLVTEPHVGDLLEQMKPLFNFGANWAEYKSEMVGYTLDRNSRTGRTERADNAIIEYLTVPLPDGAVLNSYLDVSDSVRVEQALRASNAALATADRLKSDFVANVSYQLRTPLNTITGFAEILTEQYFGTLNERQLEYTRTIKSASESLSRLINDVLDLATIEAGRMELERRPVSVAELLNEAKQMTAEWARQQSLEIIIECPSDLGTFDVDEQRMKQVLFNLISNSIKYTPAGGRIALAARREDIWIVLSILDTGIGIPESDCERVFDKFERSNLQTRQTGAGLGLSLVKSFIELHGGRIEISSDVKQGTRISCYIPRQFKADKAAGEQ